MPTAATGTVSVAASVDMFERFGEAVVRLVRRGGGNGSLEQNPT
jgi:hypothetical protein